MKNVFCSFFLDCFILFIVNIFKNIYKKFCSLVNWMLIVRFGKGFGKGVDGRIYVVF